MQCSKCGSTVQTGDRFCEECGFRIEHRASDRREINISSKLGGVCDRGLKHRRNEDYFACAEVEGKNAFILVVCDGVSSSQSPDLAATTAAESACQALVTGVGNDRMLEDVVKDAIASAQESVCGVFYTNTDDPPSTTIVAAIVQNKIATIGWLGDSRAYWISQQGSKLLTRDHSWLNEVVSSGQMTEEVAMKSANAHGISQWLGADASDRAEPSLINFKIPGTGYLLLCTDGLWNYAPESEQIAEIVHQSLNADADAVAVSRRLVEFAIARGGQDNITVAVLSLMS